MAPASETGIRIAAADRHPITRHGLSRLFDEHPAFTFVGEAEDREAALRLAEEQKPDVLILGMNLPVEDSIDVAEVLFNGDPRIRVLVLSGSDDERHLFEMLAHRVAGVLSKEESPDAIVAAAQGVASGKSGWLSRSLTSKLTKTPDDAMRAAIEAAELTPREREVLTLVAQGYRNRQIADMLFIAENTVKNHISNLFDKLEVKTRAEAVAWAWRNGFGQNRSTVL